MRKWAIPSACLLLLVAGALAASLPMPWAAAQAPKVWRVQSSWPPASPPHLSFLELAKKIEEVIMWQPALEGGPLEGTPQNDLRFAYIKYDKPQG